MKKEPHHFTLADFFKALFGSFIITISFLFKGSMVLFAVKMTIIHVFLVFIFTILLVTAEIYFLSYRFVQHRDERPFSEFWAKRFFAITLSSFIVIYLLIYVYGINASLSSFEILKLAIAIFLPAATAGAAVEMLKAKKSIS